MRLVLYTRGHGAVKRKKSKMVDSEICLESKNQNGSFNPENAFLSVHLKTKTQQNTKPMAPGLGHTRPDLQQDWQAFKGGQQRRGHSHGWAARAVTAQDWFLLSSSQESPQREKETERKAGAATTGTADIRHTGRSPWSGFRNTDGLCPHDRSPPHTHAILRLEKLPTVNYHWGGGKWSRSVVSHSLRPRGLQPTRLLCPQDSPGKSTGVGYHFLLQRIFPTQGLSPGLPHGRQMLYRLCILNVLKGPSSRKKKKRAHRSQKVSNLVFSATVVCMTWRGARDPCLKEEKAETMHLP